MDFLYSVYYRFPNVPEGYEARLSISRTPIVEQNEHWVSTNHYYVYAEDCSTQNLEWHYLNKWRKISNIGYVFYTTDEKTAKAEYVYGFHQLEYWRTKLLQDITSLKKIIDSDIDPYAPEILDE